MRKISDFRLCGVCNEKKDKLKWLAVWAHVKKIDGLGKAGIGVFLSLLINSGIRMDRNALAIAKAAQDGAQAHNLTPAEVSAALAAYVRQRPDGGEPEAHAHKPAKKKPAAKALLRGAGLSVNYDSLVAGAGR